MNIDDDDAKTLPSRSVDAVVLPKPKPSHWRRYVLNALMALLVIVSIVLFGAIGGLVARAVPVRLQGCQVMCCAEHGEKP